MAWLLANCDGSLFKRRDFTFYAGTTPRRRALLAHESTKELPLFSDLGRDVFIPTPEKEYPLAHFLDLPYAQQ